MEPTLAPEWWHIPPGPVTGENGSGHGRRDVISTLVGMATLESASPATGDVLGSVPEADAAAVDAAVEKARAAYQDWRLVPAPRRGEILFRFAQVLEREKAALTDLMTREMGKVKAEAGGDVQEAIDMTYYMAGEGRRLWGQTTPSELPEQVQHVGAHARRRGRCDHAVELPDRDPVVEDRAGARVRQHRRAEAGGGHAAPRRAVRRAARRGGPARRASSTSSTATARRPALRSSATRTSP